MKKMAIVICTLISSSTLAQISHYGFIKGSYLRTDKQLTNDYKVFSVGNTDNYTNLQKESRGQFSFKQSRWGLKGKKGKKLSALMEFDLDGQSGNSNGAVATSTGIIRVRQANLTYKVIEDGTINFGKKWTKFVGLLPHTYSVTTVNFKSGNTGFLVDGLDYTHQLGDVALALELHNMGTGDDTTNKVSGPVMVANLEYDDEVLKVGLAYTQAELKHKIQNEATNEDSTATGMKIYTSTKAVDGLDFRAEYYMGENLASIHTGALASAVTTDAKKYEEKGYFTSAKYSFGDMGIFAGHGSTEFNQKEEAGLGNISGNTMTRFGFDTKLDKGITAFIEYQMFKTTINDSSVVTTNKDYEGNLIDIGLFYKF